MNGTEQNKFNLLIWLKRYKARILIGLFIIVAVLIGYTVYEGSKPTILIIQFNPSVTSEQAITILSKYHQELATRSPFEYDNPEFKELYPFPEQRKIQITTSQVDAYLIKKKLWNEQGITWAAILPVIPEELVEAWNSL